MNSCLNRYIIENELLSVLLVQIPSHDDEVTDGMDNAFLGKYRIIN